jgi:hypothetical protein
MYESQAEKKKIDSDRGYSLKQPRATDLQLI